MATTFGSLSQPTPRWAKVLARVVLGAAGLLATVFAMNLPMHLTDAEKLSILEWSGASTTIFYYIMHMFHIDVSDVQEDVDSFKPPKT
jgi:hypothetical protein